MYRTCDLDKLQDFIFSAKPNEKFIYYEGFSLTDTLLTNELRKILYQYSVNGRVYLVQQKVRNKIDPHYVFIAIKASTPPIVKLVPFSDQKVRERERRMSAHGSNQRTSESVH